MEFEMNKCKYSILKAMAFSQFFELNLDGENDTTRHRNTSAGCLSSQFVAHNWKCSPMDF